MTCLLVTLGLVGGSEVSSAPIQASGVRQPPPLLLLLKLTVKGAPWEMPPARHAGPGLGESELGGPRVPDLRSCPLRLPLHRYQSEHGATLNVCPAFLTRLIPVPALPLRLLWVRAQQAEPQPHPTPMLAPEGQALRVWAPDLAGATQMPFT